MPGSRRCRPTTGRSRRPTAAAPGGSEIRLTPSSFDGELAPVASGGPMIGDYEGLAHAGNTFLAAFEVGNNASDPTDIDITGFTP